MHIWFDPVAAIEIDSTATDALRHYATSHHSSPPITKKSLLPVQNLIVHI